MSSLISQFFSLFFFSDQPQKPDRRRSQRLDLTQPLVTAKIRNEDNLLRISHVALRWNKRARSLSYGPICETCEKQATDAQIVYKLIEKKLRHSKAYVAYDRTYKIQGIAFATFTPSGKCSLDVLASNPDNLAFSHQREKTKGVGVTLLAHVCSDILSRKTKHYELFLESTDTAETFYQHLGFIPSRLPTFEWMLQREKMKALVSKHAHFTKLNSKEPTLSSFAF